MPDVFFSSSWRILEPYGRAVQRLAQKGRRSPQRTTPGVQSVEHEGLGGHELEGAPETTNAALKTNCAAAGENSWISAVSISPQQYVDRASSISVRADNAHLRRRQIHRQQAT